MSLILRKTATVPHMPNELIHKIMESTHDDPYTLSQCIDLYLDLRGLRYDILPKLVRLFEVLDEVTRHVRILYLVLSDIDDAEYNFAGDLISDENDIIFPTSLTLELSKRLVGDIALLEKSSNYLTSLTLVYYSHNPARYISIAHITAESFPSLDTLSLVFHIGSTFSIPIDLPQFLQGHKRSSKVKHVNITFDHESCVFSDMKDYFSTTIKNAKAPFSTKEVFDRKVLRCLESGSCKLLMTSEDLSVSRAADIGPFKADVQIKMNALFPTDELPWVNVKVVLEERFWEFIDF
ncbi:hypothetical protein CVT26_003376 [Gymnopilus dilepis]|uniref:Uncharacterized protein n=1 Tax=Gymnopilus dilepis TaxID=231916 RepID=A0A409Y5G1_9AGAR|nr:hypothetical protein CVT26_003376 [Gymnopilus dilepis]